MCFLVAKGERVCPFFHLTEDHNLVEIMKNRFFFAMQRQVQWRCDCFDQVLVIESLLPVKVMMKVPIKVPLRVNAQKVAFDRRTGDLCSSSSGNNRM